MLVQETPVTLTIASLPGVTLTKWTRAWAQRQRHIPLAFISTSAANQESVLRDGLADVSFVRLPVDRTGLSVIPLYDEAFVVVVPKDHPVSAFEGVSVADLADEEQVSNDLSSEDAVGLVAAGGGIVILPQSLARLHTRKDVVARPVTDLPTSTIAIAWMEERTTSQVDEFVGIVRGRTAASSRAVPTPKLAKASKSPSPQRPTPQKTRGGRSGRTRRSGGR